MTDGSSNTTAIINAQGNTGSYAAKLCRDFGLGGYNDWFLPSKDQLHRLYLQKDIIGNIENSTFWSSTEQDNLQAWVQSFANGSQTVAQKSTTYLVRPIRAF